MSESADAAGPVPNRPLDTKALELLAEVASYLAAGLGSEEVLARVAGVLARGLQSDRCRIWVRTADGASFRAIVGEGYDVPGNRPSDEIRLEPGVHLQELRGDQWTLRYPLRHEGEELGLLEAWVPDGPAASALTRVVQIVANVLSPLLAAIELSEDLASEVAMRTREIEAQRRFTAKIIDSLPVGLYVIDRDYRIQAWNRKRETGTQGVVREEAIGRTVFDILHRQPHSLLKREFDRVFRTGQLEAMETSSETFGERRYYRLTKIPMRVDGDEVTHVITIGEDVTEWKDVQQQVSQTEKLAAVGQLAAGVMHEINNPLATIGACVEALGLRRDDLPEHLRQGMDEYLRIIESELTRCNSIVNGLLDFSRPKARMKREAQINQVVEDALFLVRHHDRFKGIQLQYHDADNVPTILANTEQLIQVFLALMLNAIDAMEGTGQLTVRTLLNPDRSDEVVVSIADTGAGISGEDIPKIFEPFFTTKQPGRGTGLGLSICYGIVQEHGGRLTVDSQVGHGTEFRVFLPTPLDAGP
jgi:two-component system, NtrC family, sensor kinase